MAKLPPLGPFPSRPLVSARAPAGPAATSLFTAHPTDATSGGSLGYSTVQPTNPNILAGYVNSQPNVLAARGLANFQGGQADDALRNAIQQAVTSWGDPNIARQMGLAVDPKTAALALANTQAGHSQLAQLNLAANQSHQNMLASLAAGGIAHSGALGYNTMQGNAADSLAQFNAGSQVSQGLNAANRTDLGVHQTGNFNVNNAIGKAQGVVNANPTAYPMPHDGLFRVGAGMKPNMGSNLGPAAPTGPRAQPNLSSSPRGAQGVPPAAPTLMNSPRGAQGAPAAAPTRIGP